MRYRRPRSFGGSIALIATGAALTAIGTRVLSPFAGQAMGSARHALGGDPFDALARDHRLVLELFEAIERTPADATMRRATMFFQLKRMLSAHALAEEDVVYPLLHDQADEADAAYALYREHADMKMGLHTLDSMAKDDPNWVSELRRVRDLVAAHARKEEEVEFPRLREALDAGGTSRIAAEIGREKALIL
jgi:hemerythrin superfamily protein